MVNRVLLCFAAVLFCGIIWVSATARAEEFEVAESFDEGPEHGKINTADATPVEPGDVEIEASYSYGSANRAWDNDENAQSRGFTSGHAARLSLTAGLIDNLDVSLAFGHSWLRDEDNDYDEDGVAGPTTGSGFADLDFSARYRFIHSASYALDMAYIAGFTAPTGTRNSDNHLGTSQDYWSFNQTLAASKDWGPWTGNAAAGFSLPIGERKGSARGTFNADAAAGYQVLPWLQPEAELNYSRDYIASDNDAESLAVTAGLVMPINENVRVNIGVQQGVWGRNADKATTASLAVKIAF